MRWMTLARSAVCVGALAPAVAAAQVPPTMTFTARVTDGDDVLTGQHAFSFRMFDAATGGTLRWEEAHTGVAIADGLITVALGSNTPFTVGVLSGSPLWIEVVLDGASMSPRLPLRSAPYALRAGDAATLGGQPGTAFAAYPLHKPRTSREGASRAGCVPWRTRGSGEGGWRSGERAG